MAVDAGHLLRDARRRHGLTQAQLAARARTSQAAISRIERGLVSPTISTLGNLLRLVDEDLVLASAPRSATPPPRMGEPGWFPDHGEERRAEFARTTPAGRIAEAIALSDVVTTLAVAGRHRR